MFRNLESSIRYYLFHFNEEKVEDRMNFLLRTIFKVQLNIILVIVNNLRYFLMGIFFGLLANDLIINYASDAYITHLRM